MILVTKISHSENNAQVIVVDAGRGTLCVWE